MFAFAIWDEKEKKLFAARDRFGEKPFFYFFDETRFLFASEMKALWAAGVPKTPNGGMLFNFLTIGYTDNPAKPGETFYRDIYKLPAATTLEFSLIYFTFSLTNYWQIDPEAQLKKIGDEEAIGTFGELLRTSVQRRLRSDVPVGSSLSGGLDSSTLASLAAQSLRKESGIGPSLFHSFTASFPGFEKDETALARSVAEQNGMPHHAVNMTADDLLRDWQKLSFHQEEPFGSASIFAQYKVMQAASAQGTKVLLDGQGADETLAGYTRYYKWYWQELFRQRRLYRSGELRAAKELGIRERFDYRNMIAAYFPSFATIVLERQYLVRALKQEDLTREFVREQSRDAYYTTPDHFTLNGVLHFSTCVHGLEELLRYADRNAMAHGLELRLPFLSHELVEYLFSLPSSCKIRQGWSKWILRKSMDKALPPEIAWRRDKTGFEPPQKTWMENAGLQEAIREAKRKLVEEKILNPASLDKPIVPAAAHDSESHDWRYFSSAFLFQ